MKPVQVFDFNDNPIRTTQEENGNTMFVARDVALVLGYVDTDQAIRKHCTSAIKGGVKTTGGLQELSLIREPDLYRLIFGSKLESAIAFQDWVFNEVLPSIRKTGEYKLNKRMDILESLLTDKQRHTANVLDNVGELIENYFDWSSHPDTWIPFTLHDVYYEACMGDCFIKSNTQHLTAIKSYLVGRGIDANGIFKLPRAKHED